MLSSSVLHIGHHAGLLYDIFVFAVYLKSIKRISTTYIILMEYMMKF